MREWVLAEVNYGYVKEHPYSVAVLPMGATEPHNLHLPYGTDTFEVEAIAHRACEAAFKQGARVVALPAIPYGTETNLAKFPLAMNLNPSTLLRVIGDLVESLHGCGVRKLLILNGHGGNEFKPVLRELQGRTAASLFLCDWFRGLSADMQKKIFKDPGDHAGEMETAMGLAFFPEHVAHDAATGKIIADEGRMAATRFEAINNGWVSISRPWHLLTTNSGAGNPHPATAEQGRKLMDAMVDRLAGFLVELAAAEMDERFPY